MRQPKIIPVPGQKKYVLAEDYKHKTLTIQQGFNFNGCSIPKPFHSFMTPFQPILIMPALVHDYCYSTHLIPRKQADKAFKRHLIQNGVAKWKAGLMYRMLRIFGMIAWNNGHS